MTVAERVAYLGRADLVRREVRPGVPELISDDVGVTVAIEVEGGRAFGAKLRGETTLRVNCTGVGTTLSPQPSKTTSGQTHHLAPAELRVSKQVFVNVAAVPKWSLRTASTRVQQSAAPIAATCRCIPFVRPLACQRCPAKPARIPGIGAGESYRSACRARTSWNDVNAAQPPLGPEVFAVARARTFTGPEAHGVSDNLGGSENV